MEHVQNKSPNPPTSLSPSCLFRIVHNQAGYSSSARATGSLFAFSKFRPFSGVPAGTLLLTSGVAFFSTALAAAFSIEGVGEGVRGALKGCAAEDEVAAGGAFGVGCEAEEMGVALREGRVVERRRRVGKKCEARWQVRQIMVWVCGCVGVMGRRRGVLGLGHLSSWSIGIIIIDFCLIRDRKALFSLLILAFH